MKNKFKKGDIIHINIDERYDIACIAEITRSTKHHYIYNIFIGENLGRMFYEKDGLHEEAENINIFHGLLSPTD